MKAMPSWNSVLAAPAPRDHLVQLYTSELSLVRTVAEFVQHGLADGDAVIAIATGPHWTDVVARLGLHGTEVGVAKARGQLIVLDAHDALRRLMVGGVPERAAMHSVVMPALQAARAAGYSRIRAFGEMVDILNRRRNLAAAIRLEELWNDLLETEQIALLCGYALDPFDRAEYKETLPRIGDMHSHLMPVADAERMEGAIDRAFIDVFGLHSDTSLLRDLCVGQLPTSTAMPKAQGALFALRDLDPRLADAVLERAATYYRGA
jgi:DcmR-like sensory protein